MKKDKSLEYTRCNYCKSQQYKIIETFESDDLIQINKSLQKNKKHSIGLPNNKLTVVQCLKCKLTFINPRLSTNDLMKFYEGFYAKQFSGDKVAFENTVYSLVNEEQEIGRLLEIQRFIKKGKLLDIGAGPGHFLKTAKTGGWKIYGQDLSLHAAQIAMKDFGIRITNAPIENLPFPDNFFDCITMHSTLEHTRNPRQYINNAFKKLKPGGLLVFSTPNIRSINFYLAKILRLPYPGFIFEHLYYFSPNVIKKMLGNRFDILEMTSFHHSRLLLPSMPTQKKQKKPENKYTLFLKELVQTKQKWLYIRQRLYHFQMRILRESLEHNRTVGNLQFGDVLYIFAIKK